MKAFSDFLRTDEAKRSCDPALLDRILATGDSITSFNNLVKFTKERFPDHFSDDPRKALDKSCGINAMKKLWAAFLHWDEVASEKTTFDKTAKK